MDDPRPRKRKTRKKTVAPEEGEDFISNLPEDLKHKILSCLSIRDAVNTSVLSSNWRNTWASMPEVSIREADFVSPGASAQITRIRFIKFVDVFLYLHKAPIVRFQLESGRHNNYHYTFDRWILHLSSRNELCELSLNFGSLWSILPTSLFSCHGLSILKLHGCRINLPRGFQGFKSMLVLELQKCCIHKDDLEKFVSSCPILVEFVMAGSWICNSTASPASLKIDAPKLKKLIINGGYERLSLKTPCLVNACFELFDVLPPINGRCNLVEALGSLSEIEVLRFHQPFLVYRQAGLSPNLFSSPFNKLRMLALDVNLASTEEASLFRNFLENSPNLQKLELTNRTSPLNSGGSWQSGLLSCCMSLRVVQLQEFFFSQAEFEFFKFILASAPCLEQLNILEKRVHPSKKIAVVGILQRIPRHSRNLQITWE